MLRLNTIHMLGQDEEAPTEPPGQFTPEQEQTIERILELEKKIEELKETRSRRFWGAIAGIATASTAIIAILTFATRKK